MNKQTIEVIDLNNQNHTKALLYLLNEYMKDDMGSGETMSADIASEIISGLKMHTAYLGFLVKQNDEFVALPIAI